MRALTYSCEVCSVAKSEANHWLMGKKTRYGYTLGDWNDHWGKSGNVEHFCGITCALTRLAQFIQRGSDTQIEINANDL